MTETREIPEDRRVELWQIITFLGFGASLLVMPVLMLKMKYPDLLPNIEKKVKKGDLPEDSRAELERRNVDVRVAVGEKLATEGVAKVKSADSEAKPANSENNGVKLDLQKFQAELASLKAMKIDIKSAGDLIAAFRFQYPDNLLSQRFVDLPQYEEFLELILRRLMEMQAWYRENPDELPAGVSSYTELRLVGQNVYVHFDKIPGLKDCIQRILQGQLQQPDTDLILANMNIWEAMAEELVKDPHWPHMQMQFRHIFSEIKAGLTAADKDRLRVISRFWGRYLRN